MSYEFLTHSAAETIDAGTEIAKKLGHRNVICLFGDLGAGKTTLIKGIQAYFAPNTAEKNPANSPTFVYLNIYEGQIPIYHFDLYRLRDADEFLGMGFDEYLFMEGVCCIEWSERITALIPSDCVRITLTHSGGDTRRIFVSC